MTHSNFEIIIADTSCLILLTKIGEIELLQRLFGKVIITSIIAEEFKLKLPDWITIDDNFSEKTKQLIEIEVDKGEASAIALCLEHGKHLLIIDDLKGRKLAKKLGINFIGTMAVLLKTIEIGLIKDKKDLIEKIRKTNFHFSDDLLKLLDSQ